MKPWIERHPIVSFYIVAYTFSWAIAVPLALQAQGAIATRLPLWLHYLTAFGPAFGALLVGRLSSPPPNPSRNQGSRLFWILVGILSPLFLFTAALGIGWWFGQAVPTWMSLGNLNFLPPIGLWAWVLWVATSGIGEESGWRGFALPRLQTTHSALASSLLLSLAWAGWHAPAFFYVPSFMALGVKVIPGFFLGILAGAIVLTWLYNSSGGSVLAVILWHASFNYVTASPNAAGLAAAVVSTGVIVFAIGILLACPSRTLVMRSVHATKLERSQPLPGDEIIPDPIGEFTHGITIAASRRAIWPWLVQMGSTRAGWYSYDRLDNEGAPSADRILTAFQTTAPGTLFPALPRVTEGFVLIAADCERWLILGWPNPNSGYVVSWTFVMREQGPHRTRLLVRARGSKTYRFHKLPAMLGIPLVRFVHFVMERKQLLGIARRAEHLAETVSRRQRAAGWNLVFENR
jgi:CAAX protease family protein